MRMKTKQITIAMSLALPLALGACATTEKPKVDQIPDWIADPQGQVDDGLAVAECIPASNNFSLDKKESTAQARQTLAQQIETRVQAMDKTYQRRVRTEEGTTTGNVFESVSKQITEQNLNGARVAKTGYERFNEQRQLCTMVVMGEQKMKEIFDQIVEQSGAEVDPQDERVLYEEFKAHKAQEELQRSLEND